MLAQHAGVVAVKPYCAFAATGVRRIAGAAMFRGNRFHGTSSREQCAINTVGMTMVHAPIALRMICLSAATRVSMTVLSDA